MHHGYYCLWSNIIQTVGAALHWLRYITLATQNNPLQYFRLLLTSKNNEVRILNIAVSTAPLSLSLWTSEVDQMPIRIDVDQILLSKFTSTTSDCRISDQLLMSKGTGSLMVRLHPLASSLCVILTILVAFSWDNALFASKAKINVVWKNFKQCWF